MAKSGHAVVFDGGEFALQTVYQKKNHPEHFLILMKILLYTPPVPKQSIHVDYLISCEPLELEYLYTVLSPKHAVSFLEKGSRRLLYEKIKTDRISMLCISCYITHVPGVLTLVKQLKIDFPSLYIAVGGVYAEVVPEHFFSPDIDAVIFGNHLAAIVAIADGVAAGMLPDKMDGVAFRTNDFQYEPVRTNIQVLPVPDRVLFQQHPEKYYYMYFKSCASIKTSVGCPGKCTFCFCRKMNNGMYQARSVEQVINEIESIATENIFILDDNFLTNVTRLEQFCEALESKNIWKKFIVYGTAHFVSTHPELMLRLKNNGVSALIVGFESITSEGLELINKDASTEDNDKTIAICKELDIELFALFICEADWHHRDFRALASYIRKKEIRFATFSTSTIFPETDIAIELKLKFDIPSLWRYDLLRLHEKPRNIPTAAYYWWLYMLYLTPLMRFSSFRHILKRYGFWGGLGVAVKSSTFGLIYLVKLLIWK